MQEIIQRMTLVFQHSCSDAARPLAGFFLICVPILGSAACARCCVELPTRPDVQSCMCLVWAWHLGPKTGDTGETCRYPSASRKMEAKTGSISGATDLAISTLAGTSLCSCVPTCVYIVNSQACAKQDFQFMGLSTASHKQDIRAGHK